jgi:hypothetical protein
MIAIIAPALSEKAGDFKASVLVEKTVVCARCGKTFHTMNLNMVICNSCRVFLWRNSGNKEAYELAMSKYYPEYKFHDTRAYDFEVVK